MPGILRLERREQLPHGRALRQAPGDLLRIDEPWRGEEQRLHEAKLLRAAAGIGDLRLGARAIVLRGRILGGRGFRLRRRGGSGIRLVLFRLGGLVAHVACLSAEGSSVTGFSGARRT